VQFEAIKDYCKKNNIEIVAEFSDAALSGDDIERPGLWAAKDEIRRGYLLIVFKLDRIARDVYLSEIFERAVTSRGGKILSVSGEGTWNDTSEEKLIRQILHAVSEYERKIIAYRTKVAMLRHQKGGRLMSSKPPYGTMIDPANPKRIVPNPEEQEIIKHIVELRKSGLSIRTIARELTENPDLKPRLKERKFKDRKIQVRSKWSRTKIHSILRRANAC